MTVKTEGADAGAGDAGAAAATSDDAFAEAFKDFAAPEGEAGAGAGAAAAAGAGGADAGAGGDGAGGSGAAGADGAAAGADGGADGAAAGGGADGAGAGDGKGGAADGAAGAAAAGADAGAGAGAAEPKAPTDAEAILEGLKKLVGERPAAEAGAGAGADGAAAGGGDAGAGGAAEPEIYNAEEKTFLEAYAKDWGDVQKGEALIRRAEYRQLLGYVFQQVSEFVKPIQQTAEVLATRTHLSDIETNIPDYSDKLRDDVTTWVKEQPAYLQAAYNQVITQGTVEEVKDLVERYRAATVQPAQPAGGPGAGAPKPGKDNELSEPAKKAAAALAPVESKRSVVLQPDDPSNFDDAWKQAAADLG